MMTNENKKYAEITDEKEMSPIDQIKHEFMSRYGVDVNIQLLVHSHHTKNKHLTKELAEYIVKDWGSTATHNESKDGETTWVNNWESSHEDGLEVSVFYDKSR